MTEKGSLSGATAVAHSGPGANEPRVEASGLREAGRRGAKAMTREELLARITVDPAVCFGKPCIRGHRIPVALILHLLASGWSVQEVLKDCRGLEEADVLACIAYGAEMARERVFDIPAEASR
jgi:uncharacterized protein (DUF433 family)